MRYSPIWIALVLLVAGTAAADDAEGARTQYLIAAGLADAGECLDAIPRFDKTLELDPTFCRAHLGLAKCLLEVETRDAYLRAKTEAAAFQKCAGEGEMSEVMELVQKVLTTPEPVEPEPEPVEPDPEPDDEVIPDLPIDEADLLVDETDMDPDDVEEGDPSGSGAPPADRPPDDEGGGDARVDPAETPPLDRSLDRRIRRHAGAGTVMLLGGGAAVGVGIAMNVRGYRHAQEYTWLGEDGEWEYYEEDEDQVTWARQMNSIGMATAIGGAALSVAGVITLATTPRRPAGVASAPDGRSGSNTGSGRPGLVVMGIGGAMAAGFGVTATVTFAQGQSRITDGEREIYETGRPLNNASVVFSAVGGGVALAGFVIDLATAGKRTGRRTTADGIRVPVFAPGPGQIGLSASWRF